MAELLLYGQYDRRAVHDIFEPDTPFTPGAGKWGIRGIVPLGASPGDFVLFVTFGKQEGDHLFDESISSEGILRWESEPKQTLESRRIKELIAHDERINTVYLFLRTTRLHGGVAPPFTYLGPLKYLNHDSERELPAHIAWQLLEWPIPPEVAGAMRLDVVPETAFSVAPGITEESGPTPSENYLGEEPPPTNAVPVGEPTQSFTARKRRYLSSDESKDLGLRGERLVLLREQKRLLQAGRGDLAKQVIHTSVAEGDGAGYDIRSFFADGRTKFIEVKTTTGPKSSDFFVSPNELAFSAANPTQFELCRVFNYNSVQNTGVSFSLFGNIADALVLTETQYRASVGSKEQP